MGKRREENKMRREDYINKEKKYRTEENLWKCTRKKTKKQRKKKRKKRGGEREETREMGNQSFRWILREDGKISLERVTRVVNDVNKLFGKLKLFFKKKYFINCVIIRRLKCSRSK